LAGLSSRHQLATPIRLHALDGRHEGPNGNATRLSMGRKASDSESPIVAGTAVASPLVASSMRARTTESAAATPPHAGAAQMSGARTGIFAEGDTVIEVVANSPDEAATELAQQAIFEDIDSILARLQHDFADERTAMDALLDRLTSKAA
jgi:hypothetical protein